MTNRTHRDYRTYTLFFIFYLLFFIFTPISALAQCVATCPSGQTATGECQIDLSCNNSTQTCPRGVTCSTTRSAPTPRTGASNTPTLPNIKALCFTEPECKAAPYEGEPRVSADCKNQDERWTKAGYTFQCYAKSASVDLQVSIGGYKVTGIDQYIKRLYTYLAEIAGIVAGIMIVWAGVKWLTSAGIPDRISDAKKKIGNAVIGLVLVLSSYIILQTINPALVNFKLPPVTMMRQDRLGVGSCVKREQYPCGGLHLKSPLAQDSLGVWENSWDDLAELFDKKDGTYQCNDPRNPYISGEEGKPFVPPCEGGIKSAKCTPQYCPNSTMGCNTLTVNRITTEALRKLEGLNRASLPAIRNAGVPLPIGLRDIEDVTQAQGIVTDFINSAKSSSKICVQKSQCGNKCDSSVPWAVCISSVCDCVLGIGTNSKVVCVPPLEAGKECKAHGECQSNRCNFGRFPNKCTPVGGELENAPCKEDADCNSAQSLLCNKGIVAYNRCRPKEVGGEMCTRDIECNSNSCNKGIFSLYQLGCCGCRNASGGLEFCWRDVALNPTCSDD